MPGGKPSLRPVALLVTCEHGGNRIPARYRALFAGCEALLASHRGYDPGALTFARELAKALDAPLFCSTTSRLLVELNRSPGHRQLFSAPVRRLPREAREELMARHYRPYRDRVEEWVATALARGRRVVHLSSHSFTPVLEGVERHADVGLLFDPARKWEATFCATWRAALAEWEEPLRVRRNYPYRGSADGFIPYLRRRFSEADYIGIELEVNQRFPLGDARLWQALREALVKTFAATLRSIAPTRRELRSSAGALPRASECAA